MFVISVPSAFFLLLIVTLLLREKLLESHYKLILVVDPTLPLKIMGTFLLYFRLISLVTILLIFCTKIIRTHP